MINSSGSSIIERRASAVYDAVDNAVTSADDAFGNNVGTENIGLYNALEVRGLSAIDAGNVRLDGCTSTVKPT